MGLEALDSRNIRAEFLRQLSVADGQAWVGQIASPVIPSDRSEEEYRDLFDVPAMKKTHGERTPVTLLPREYSIKNEYYETSMLLRDSIVRRAKLPLLQMKLRQLAIRVQEYWAKILSGLIVDGASTTAWSPDGQFFYDTDHSEGNSGTQDNDITVDISAQPVSTAGTTTAPSLGEAAYTMLRAFEALWGFVDTEGEPMNEGASSFSVQVPTTLAGVFKMAAKAATLEDGSANPVAGMDIDVHPNQRLNATSTDTIWVFITDQQSFIRQLEDGPNTDHLGPGTTFYIMNNKQHFFGVDLTGNAGYGHWQKSIQAQMV